MDEDQVQAYNLIIGGHNLCRTGQAGTGKSYAVKKAVKKLRKRGMHVVLTCSTGIGPTVFDDEKPCIVHKWDGLEDGRHENNTLLHLIMNDERYTNVKHEIQTTDYLFIDEVSMISSKMFNQVEFICRNVRKSPVYFGNSTVVLSGDVWQLPPVRNELHGDFGHHYFTTSWFDTVFTHHVNLNIIDRQSDTILINAINELERGTPSPTTIAFMNSVTRPLSDEMKKISVHRFARNIDCDLSNYNKVQDLSGELHVFPSVDEGDTHYLNTFLAPKNLGLKIGCPVMLLVNLSNELVNGKIGKVSNISVEDNVNLILKLWNCITQVVL
jgi:ATP-dependent DNA helicase PIF1